jgi:hypothetical protein
MELSDPFVAYVIEHDLKNDHFALSREILRVLSDGREHGFSELLEETGNTRRPNMCRSLKYILALAEKNFDVFGFKVVKVTRNRNTFYRLEFKSDRGELPAERERRHSSPRRPEETIDVSGDLEVLRRRIGIALSGFGINDVKIKDKPGADFDSKVSNASWFLYDEKRKAVVDMFAAAAKNGQGVSTLWICEKADISNASHANHFSNLDRDTHRRALDLGFVVAKVGTGYYAVFELDDASRKKALKLKHRSEFADKCTYLDRLKPFSYKELVGRLNEFEEDGYKEIDVKRRNLTLNVAAAQRKGKNINVKEAATSIGQKSIDFTADWIAESKRLRYKSGFYLRYRSDDKLECCLLDEEADSPMDIKPSGVTANY